MSTHALTFASLVALTTVATPAWAQGAGEPTGVVGDSSADVLVDVWEPGVLPGFDVLGLAGSRVPGHLSLAFGLMGGYVGRPLEVVLESAQRTVVNEIVSARWRLDVTAALGLFDRFAVALQMPVVLAQSGETLELFGRPAEKVASGGTGDMRLGLRGRVVEGAGFGLALGLDMSLPTGTQDSFLTTRWVRVAPVVAIDWYAESGLGVVVNLGWRVNPEVAAHNLVTDDAFAWGVGLVMPTPVEHVDVRATLSGLVSTGRVRDPSGAANGSGDRADRIHPIELDMALGIAEAGFRVELGGGAGLSRGIGAPAFRGFLGVTWTPTSERVVDSDGDGIVDGVDLCPMEAEDRDGFEDVDGCPDLDNDADGVADGVDGAPDVSGFGACREAPEDADGFEDQDGCPDLDNDGDGVPDVRDGAVDDKGFGGCRDVAEDLDGFVDEDGCPEVDNDGDGVPDLLDGAVDASGFGGCRDAAETVNEYRDEDGCPDDAPKSVRVTRFKIEILEKVFFETNKASIKAQSFKLLDEVARVLVEAPALTKVQVEGHTDWNGGLEYNDTLSQARAQSVVDYLEDRGVAPGRLVAMGYGERRPLVDGPAGRREPGLSMNRRVEFVILEVDGKPHSPDKPVILDQVP